TRLMTTPSSTGSFTTPTALISPATAFGADAPDRPQRIDRRLATCQKSRPAGRPPARRHHLVSPSDIISESAGDFVGICRRNSPNFLHSLISGSSHILSARLVNVS